MLRLVVVSVKCTAIPSMDVKDQEILRNLDPNSVAIRLVGGEGGPGRDQLINYIHTYCH